MKKNTKKCASFSRVFIFQTKHILCRKKIYQRYGQFVFSKNCLNHSTFVGNFQKCNMMCSQDVISFGVHPPPLIDKIKATNTICRINYKKNVSSCDNSMKLGTNTLCLILIVNVYVASMKIQDGRQNQRWPPQKNQFFQIFA